MDELQFLNTNLQDIHGKKQNKGEWSEFYVFLKLLGEGALFTADNKLNKNPNCYLDILNIVRQEFKDIIMNYNVNKNTCLITIKANDKTLKDVPMVDFLDAANKLLDGLNMKGSSIPAPTKVCDFAKFIYVSKPKAPSVKALEKDFGGKNDIYIEAKDSQTAVVTQMGFSIKSQYSHPATLFNASTSSQLLYKVSNCDDTKMNEFNNISDCVSGKVNRGWGLCVDYLNTHNMDLTFTNACNTKFDNNMYIIRNDMNEILSEYVKDRLITGYKDNHNVMEMTDKLVSNNPLNINLPDILYKKTIKDFLMASFTGMTASSSWNGTEQVSGGYIVVLDNGDVICYHSVDREGFRDYLYRNTHFEYVSANKYKWSYMYKDGNDYYLPLNFSIRFNNKTR